MVSKCTLPFHPCVFGHQSLIFLKIGLSQHHGFPDGNTTQFLLVLSGGMGWLLMNSCDGSFPHSLRFAPVRISDQRGYTNSSEPKQAKRPSRDLLLHRLSQPFHHWSLGIRPPLTVGVLSHGFCSHENRYHKRSGQIYKAHHGMCSPGVYLLNLFHLEW